MTPARTRSRLLLAALLGAGLAACAPTVEPHGYLPQPERLSQVEPGRTKSDVLTVLGTPSTSFNVGTDRWYYISNQTEWRTWHQVEEVSRTIIVIDFDKSGKVTAVRKLTLADGKDVAMIDQETPTSGQRLTVWQQLLGNIGRFENTPEQGKTK